MVGFSVIQMAQTVRRHWDAVRSGSKFCVNPKGCSKNWTAEHPFSYRDFMDIAVKWRQISEPNDPVFWIDLLAPEAFAEGFGLQTPMVTGQMNVTRYYPYCRMAIEVLRIGRSCPPDKGRCSSG